ncbi:hypothetical protein ATN84_06880 [Paramesorhizobium deserti]|uniref:Uncharacterized protein n=1 Tax=Paramesorhizobium deserti TaxID=1494590 RepID=A0A135I1U9_9HYPH|nr:hypothetical protein [Paramesorhizobium deserti]KXF79419.1 hypothetical protein ATN84_06880 [Paramesorhizobium deserti]
MIFTIQGMTGQIGQREREGRIKAAGCGRSGCGFHRDFKGLFSISQGVACLAPFCILQLSVFAQFLQGFGG